MDGHCVIKLMRKKRKLFPWLKSFCSRYTKNFFSDSSNEIFEFLLLNIDKEVKSLALELKKEKADHLFDLLNTLVLHFVWQIRWKTCKIWKTYSKKIRNQKISANNHQKYCCAKVFHYLILLALYLTENDHNSYWINRILTAITIFHDALDITYDALLFINDLKKKYCPIFRVILKKVLCSRVGGDISDPIMYSKQILLFRRLLKFTKDEEEKKDILLLASKLEPPLHTMFWFATQNIGNLDTIENNNLTQNLLLRPYPDDFLRKLTQVVIKEELSDRKTIQNAEDQVTSENFQSNIFSEKNSLITSDVCKNGLTIHFSPHKDENEELHSSEFSLKPRLFNYQGTFDAISEETSLKKKTEKYFKDFNCKKKKNYVNNETSSSIISVKRACYEEDLEKIVGIKKTKKEHCKFDSVFENLNKTCFKTPVDSEKIHADNDSATNFSMRKSLDQVNISQNHNQCTVKQKEIFSKYEKKKELKEKFDCHNISNIYSEEKLSINLSNCENVCSELSNEINTNKKNLSQENVNFAIQDQFKKNISSQNFKKHSEEILDQNYIEGNLPYTISKDIVATNLQNYEVSKNISSNNVSIFERQFVLHRENSPAQDIYLKKKKSKLSKSKKNDETNNMDAAPLINHQNHDNLLLKCVNEIDTSDEQQIALENENLTVSKNHLKKKKHSKKSKINSKQERFNRASKNPGIEKKCSAHLKYECLDNAPLPEINLAVNQSEIESETSLIPSMHFKKKRKSKKHSKKCSIDQSQGNEVSKNNSSKKCSSKRMKVSEHQDEKSSNETIFGDEKSNFETNSSLHINDHMKKKKSKKYSLKEIESDNGCLYISDPALLPNSQNCKSPNDLSSNDINKNEKQVLLESEKSLVHGNHLKKKKKSKKKSKKHSKEKTKKKKRVSHISETNLHNETQSITETENLNSDFNVSKDCSNNLKIINSNNQNNSKNRMKKLFNQETFKMNEDTKSCNFSPSKSNVIEVNKSKFNESEHNFKNKEFKLSMENICPSISNEIKSNIVDSEMSEVNSQFSFESGIEETAILSDVSICELLKLPRVKLSRSYKALGIKKIEMLDSKRHNETKKISKDVKNQSIDEENILSSNELLLASKKILKQSEVFEYHSSPSLFDAELATNKMKTFISNDVNTIPTSEKKKDSLEPLKSDSDFYESSSISSAYDISLPIEKELTKLNTLQKQNTTESGNDEMNSNSFLSIDSEFDENSSSLSIHDTLLAVDNELCDNSKTPDISFLNDIKRTSNFNLSEFKTNQRSPLRCSSDSHSCLSLHKETANWVLKQANESRCKSNNEISSVISTLDNNKDMNEYQESVLESIAESENNKTSDIDITYNNNSEIIVHSTESIPTTSFNDLVSASDSNQLQNFSVTENHYIKSHSISSEVLQSTVAQTNTTVNTNEYNNKFSAENYLNVKAKSSNINHASVGTSTDSDNSFCFKIECKINNDNPESNQQLMKNISSVQVIINYKNKNDNSDLNDSKVQSSLNLLKPFVPSSAFVNYSNPLSFASNNIPNSHYNRLPIFQNQTPYLHTHSNFCNPISYEPQNVSNQETSFKDFSNMKGKAMELDYREVPASPVESSQSSKSIDTCTNETPSSGNTLFHACNSHDREFSSQKTSNNLKPNNSNSVSQRKNFEKDLGITNSKETYQFETLENSQPILLLKPLTKANIAAINQESYNISSSQSSNFDKSNKTGTDIYSNESSDDLSVSTMTLLSDFEAELSIGETLEIGHFIQNNEKKQDQLNTACHKHQLFQQSNSNTRKTQPSKLGQKTLSYHCNENDSKIKESKHEEKNLNSSINTENLEKTQPTKKTCYNLRTRTSLKKPKSYEAYYKY